LGSENSVAPEAVRAELQRILNSGQFDGSARNRRFLQYVVEEALAKRTDRIKEYSIATDVFGRDSSFDPRTDAIIRIEAGRLRRSLERYYLTAGTRDPIRIDIPKGSYVPTFEPIVADQPVVSACDAIPNGVSQGSLGPSALRIVGKIARRLDTMRARRIALTVAVFGLLLFVSLGAAWLKKNPPFAPTQALAGRDPTVIVAPFEDDGGANDTLTRGFTRELIVGLTRFEGLVVYGLETSFQNGTDPDLQRPTSTLRVDFLVTGGLTVSGNRIHVAAALVDAKTGRNVWSEVFQDDVGGDIFRARDAIAARLVQALTQPVMGVAGGAETSRVAYRNLR
jgi:adenylate cyclase